MATEATLIVPEERSATYLNRHLITGAKVGLIGALSATAAIATGGLSTLSTPFAIGLALTGGALITAGASAGCIHGKESIARNQAQGRSVSPPRLINEGMLQGMLNGAILGLGAIALLPISAAVMPWAIAGATIGTAAIAYAQGKQHQDYMQAEYEAAKHKAIGQDSNLLGKALSVAKSTGKAIGKTAEATLGAATALTDSALDVAQITAEESAQLASKLKERATEPQNWRESVSDKTAESERSL